MNHGFYTKSRSVCALPLLSLYLLGIRKEIQPLWEIASSIAIAYYIWKARCSLVFHQVKASPTDLVKSIWLEMVHTLNRQWDCIVRDSDNKVAQRH